jgi:hypothetical protein
MKVILAVTIAAASVAISSAAMAGPCIFPSDRAADGSRCGDRASTIRPGGR